MDESAEKGKKLGMINIVGLGLGGAIGSGIFVLLGSGIALAGRSISLVCLVGCVFMMLAYWYNIGMSSMFVFEGGDYGMKSMLSGPLMTGVNAWFTIVGAFAMSTYAIAVADYLSIVFPVLIPYEKIVAFVVMTLCFACSIKGSRFLTVVENVVTVVLIVALLCFVVVGLPKVDYADYLSSTYDGGFFHGGFAGFISAIAIMGFACQGTTMAPVGMSAVTKKPKFTIPVGILLITVVLAVIYGLMAIVAGGVLSYDEVAGQNLSVTAEVIFSQPMYLFFVVGGGICALLSSLLGGIGMYRYPLSNIAEDGWLPEVFKKKTSSGYPYVSYLVFYLISVIPIFLNFSLDTVVSLVMVPQMIINLYLNIRCCTLPNAYPEQWEMRSIRIPKWLFDVLSVVGAGCAIVVAWNLFTGLSGLEVVACVIVVAALFVLSEIRLKSGAVTKEALDATRERTIESAIEMSSNE